MAISLQLWNNHLPNVRISPLAPIGRNRFRSRRRRRGTHRDGDALLEPSVTPAIDVLCPFFDDRTPQLRQLPVGPIVSLDRGRDPVEQCLNNLIKRWRPAVVLVVIPLIPPVVQGLFGCNDEIVPSERSPKAASLHWMNLDRAQSNVFEAQL